MRRILPLVFLGTIVSLIVAACGGWSATATPVPPTRPVNTAAPATAAATTAANTAVPATATPRPTAPPTATPVPVPTGTMKLALDAFPGFGLLPGIGGNRRIFDSMFDALIGVDEKGLMDGKLGFVTSWEASPDLLKWTFKVRTDVTFHDGSPASAADLKHTLDFYNNADQTNPTSSGQTTRVVTQGTIDVVDSTTVSASLKSKDYFFPQRFLTPSGLGSGTGYLLPKAYMDSKGYKEANKSPVGTGPYKFKSSIDNQQVISEAWEKSHWLLGSPKFKTAEINGIPESSTRVALLKSGGADAAVVLLGDVKELKAGNFDVQAATESRLGFVELHDQFIPQYSGAANPLADVRVRKALSLAVDRDAIVATFLSGVGRPIDSHILGKANPAYKEYPVEKQEVAAAKKLLADAGYPSGFPLVMYSLMNQGLNISPEMIEAINVWWEAIGVKVTRKPLDVFAFLALVAKHDFGAPTTSGIWYSAYAPFFAGSPVGVKGTVRRDTENDTLDSLSKQLSAVTNQADYLRLAQAYADLERSERISLPLWNTGDAYAVRKGLGGDTWNLGNSSFSANFVGLLTGKRATGR